MDDMTEVLLTEEQFAEAFSLVRQHAHPKVHALLDSMERAWRVDRELLVLREVRQAMTDAMLATRLAMVGRTDD